ncbi:hypothetical protein Vqi01_42330 [Micromonospora qiuiae]|uniref:Methyltransferase type 11 domain-containing protein n=1 Tax=Micromonospora qiuiae TaxID=502268 RepID=A0ABQ4JFH1_9ACTN|nr:hypothetical protein Vqi01_42330 [Micromonospora qiuiae]
MLVFVDLPDSGRSGRAFAELARVVRPGGYLMAAFKHGDGTGHRNDPGSRVGSLGIDFDRYWLSAREMEDCFTAAGFALVFQGSTHPKRQSLRTGTCWSARPAPRTRSARICRVERVGSW